jgi:peptide/nickel transport system substrate-binding protein
VPEDTLIALAWGGDRLLMPWVNMGTMHLMFEPLFGLDREGSIEGRLVKSWEHSPDGRTWTYHLRTDVLWHDGAPFTTRDIEFTRRVRRINPLARTPDSLVIVDDSTFQRIFREAGEPLDDWNVFLPKHLLEGLDPSESWEWGFNFQPVGNGPYRYVRHVPQTMIELEANPDYYRGRPRIDRVILRLSGGEPVLELKAGNVTFTEWLSLSDLPVLERDPDLEVYWRTANGVWVLFWNHRDPILRDRRVRQALAHAVDRAEMAAALDYPGGVPFRDVPLTWNQRLRGEEPPTLPFDPDRSARLLDQAGWRDTDEDGIRERDGQSLTIEVQTPGSGMEMLVVLQSQLLKVGVRLEIVPNAGVSDLLSAIRRGQTEDVNGLQALFSDFGRCPTHFTRLVGLSPDHRSALGYLNEQMNALADAMATAIIPEDMDEICRGTWPIFQEDQPVLFLLPDLWLSAAHQKVKGLQSGTGVGIVSNILDIWIEEEGLGEGGSGEGGVS